MLYFYSGTDREKAHAALNAAVKKCSKKCTRIMRISDVSTVADLSASLQGGGMFAVPRIAVFDSLLAQDEMREMLLAALPDIRTSPEHFFMFEEKLDAATRKQIEQYAEKSEKFETVKQKEASNIFSLANALKRGDKTALWVGYHRELAKGAAPETSHGILFWGAKDLFMKSGAKNAKELGKKFLAELAELPHESRRKGIELEYALERFVLSEV